MALKGNSVWAQTGFSHQVFYDDLVLFWQV